MPTAPFASPDLQQPRSIGAPADAGEFVVIEDVPIFDAHTGDDGTEYDEHLLAQIAENNNRRIRDTGDFCPLVIGHTPEDPNSDRSPPMVGMAGPFTVGRFGNEKPRPCIFAKFWVWKDKLAQFRANPRRSVELWPESRPEDRFFDPIALLGGETPRRDLGLVYSKGRKKPAYRYEMSAAAPSGTNTFLPGGADLEYEAGDDGYEPELNLDGWMRAYAKRFADEFAGMDDEQAAERIGGLDEEDRAIVDKYFAAHCDDDDLRERYGRACGSMAGASPAGPMTRDDSFAAERYQREADEWRRKTYGERAELASVERETADLRRETSALNRNTRFQDRLNEVALLALDGLPLDDDAQLDLVYEHRGLSDEDWQAVLDDKKREQATNAPRLPVGGAAGTAGPNKVRSVAPPDAYAARRERLADEAMKIAFRYQRDPKRRHIQFPAILKHLLANRGRLDEASLAGGR